MGQIYKNATLTISATCAKTVHDGFLHPRNKVKPSVRLAISLPSRTLGTVALVGRTEELLSGPLDLRGWVLQEALLSRRRLIYEENELLWHCQSIQSEALISSNIVYVNYSEIQLPPQVFGISTLDIDSTSANDDRIYLWSRIVENYSRRKLTDRDDYPTAVVGVASELSKAWGDNYYGGLWAAFMIPSLCWHRVKTSIPLVDEAHSPSWSWLSITAPVIMLDRVFPRSFTKVLEYPHDTSIPYDWMAASRSIMHTGRIILWGPLIPLHPRDAWEDTDSMFPNTNIWYDDDRMEESVPMSELQLLIMGSSISGDANLYALLLLPMVNNVYKRIGKLDLYVNTRAGELFKKSEQRVTII